MTTITRNRSVPRGPKSLSMSLLVSVALVVPFAILELITRRGYNEEFPFTLFAFMSVLSLVIVTLITPVLRRIRADRSLGALTIAEWAVILLIAVLGYAYVSVVIDQLPCFLGVPNCD